jgi:hypothetical protein
MTEEFKSNLNQLLTTLIEDLEQEVPKRWNAIDIKMEQKEVYEVLFGQLARQITLTMQFATNQNCWTDDLAPIILRCLADNYINFSWIAKEPSSRSKKFILYGLGQEKLALEHRKKQILEDGGNPEEDLMIKYGEAWINSQRYTFLTEVNVGSWSGISTRQMAEESDCMDFYNFVYAPFSTAAHNMWGHIARYNLIQSDNPLHKFLRHPTLGEFAIDIYNIRLAVKYTDKFIRKFDETFEISTSEKSTYSKFLESFQKFEESHLTN